jgi:hypothetical protein
MIYKEFWKSETERMPRICVHNPLLPISDSDSHQNVVPLFCLALLFTSRQVYKEAREVFWTTTKFRFRSLEDVMRFFEYKQRVDGRRRPRLYPSQLIRHMRVEWQWQNSRTFDDLLYLLQTLWAIARSTNREVEIDIEHRKDWTVDSVKGVDINSTMSTVPALLTEIRDYQVRCRAANIDLRIDEKKMKTWIVDRKVFGVKLPAIGQKAEARKARKPPKDRSSN